MKACISCNMTKALDKFYIHRGMSDGRLNSCIECRKKYQRQKGKEYRRSELGRVTSIRQNERQTSLGHRAIYRRVARAVRSGRIEKKCCFICGNLNSVAHHEDYSKPLDVVWLCRPHHAERHRQMAS